MEKKTLYQTANFELIEVINTSYEELRVVSHGLADKHCVEIRLDWDIAQDFGGTSIRRKKYTGAYISHGMRGRSDTLNETREYIGVLTEAVIFVDNTLDLIRGW